MIEAPASHATAPDAYALAYEEAARALSEQERAVDSFYSRAGVLFTGGAVVTSFLGGAALSDGDTSIAAWIAVALFIAFGVRVGLLLWPQRWEFASDARQLIGQYIETDRPFTLPAIHRELALHMQASFETNKEQLSERSNGLQVAGVLLLLETLDGYWNWR
jgi:hypothetical protein